MTMVILKTTKVFRENVHGKIESDSLTGEKEARDVIVHEAAREGWGGPGTLLGLTAHVLICTRTNTAASCWVPPTRPSSSSPPCSLGPGSLVGLLAGGSKGLVGGGGVRSVCSFSLLRSCLCFSGDCNGVPTLVPHDGACLCPQGICILILFRFSFFHCLFASSKWKFLEGRDHVCVFTTVSPG